MNPYSMFLDLIDTRTFSSLWFWIALAAFWSLTASRVMGIPYDMVNRAARDAQTQGGTPAEEDLDRLAPIRARRVVAGAGALGLWGVGLGALLLTSLLLLGFVYGVEIAQALFLLAWPWLLVRQVTLPVAHRILSEGATGAELRAHLSRLHLKVQAIALVSVFVTALWGMLHNLSTGPLG